MHFMERFMEKFNGLADRTLVPIANKVANQIEYIKNADENYLIIIFSNSGIYFKRAFARTNIFKNMIHKPKIYWVTSNQDIHLRYVDKYIRYKSGNDYVSHPYPLVAISSLICLQYSQYILKKYNLKNTL